MIVAYLNFRKRSCSKHEVFISLSSVYLTAIFLILCLNVCFFHSLGAGHPLHSLSCSQTASLFSLYRNISTCQLPPQGRCWQSAKIIKTEIPLRFQLHCICTTHERRIQFITVIVMVVFSPLSVYLFSENMSVFLWHLMDRKRSVILKCWKVP